MVTTSFFQTMDIDNINWHVVVQTRKHKSIDPNTQQNYKNKNYT